MIIYESIVKELIEANKTIATMESCTGGALASEITSHPGASETLRFSAVTYSNEYKIKMGVDENIIDKYRSDTEEISSTLSDFAEQTANISNTMDTMNSGMENITTTVEDSAKSITEVAQEATALANVVENIMRQIKINKDISDNLNHELSRFEKI